MSAQVSLPADSPVDVLGSEAVLLGNDVTCDGFHKERTIRIQTHAHEDHLQEFSSSKCGDIVLTKPTLKLLSFKHPDLMYRGNVHALEYGEVKELLGNKIELFSSNHILGAAQAKVTTKEGLVLGYSGDFGWPIEDIMKVGILVVDATYGAASRIDRIYTQDDAQQEFINLSRTLLQKGPLHICASLGTMQRALYSLETEEICNGVTLIASKYVQHSVNVYRENKTPMPVITCEGTEDAQSAIKSGCYIKLHGTNAAINDGLIDGGVIQLLRYRVVGQDAVLDLPDGHYRVGLSNHADFNQTMEYIQSTGAHTVVTDSVRASKGRAGDSNNAVQLAKSIRRELGIDAFASTGHMDLHWGV